jgi:endoglycosylceramidase
MTRAAVVLLLAVTAATAAAARIDGRRLAVTGGRLVDQRGREITLRGVNARVDGVFDVTFADGRLPLEPIPTFDAGDADRMRDFGFDFLRLPINWSALEPTPGDYSRDYLARIARVVALCRARGILVLLDFHQDAFSKEIGQNGAPRWVLDLLLGPNGYPYLGGPLTDLSARRFAPATLAAFADFFADDQGVQERFARAAVALARRFRHQSAVLGYEIMNEPLVLAADAEAELLAFHTRVATAIRTVDRRHFVVFEPNVTRNVLDKAPLASTPFPDRRAIYAPHVYTDVFDLKTYTGSPADLTASMQAASMEAASWGAPLLVGEYGVDPGNPLADEWITTSLDLQDRFRAHSAFWLWEETSEGHWGLFAGESSEPGGERTGRTTALARAYARAVPGRVLEHTFDAATNHLRLRWQGRARGPVEIVLPPRRFPNGATIACDGAAVRAEPDARTHVATFPCGRGTSKHLVELDPAA